MLKSKRKIHGIDLFCGIGGFRLAMESNKIQCVFSSDIDVFAQKTYKANFGELPEGDITKISEQAIPKFDFLTAGFPCQPFSYSGRGLGFKDQTRGTLFFEILRIIRHHKPKMILLENVKGFKSHKEGKTMNVVVNSLKKEGYHVHWTILNSYDFGLPQYRERWYCVAFDRDIEFQFPIGTMRGTKLRDIIDFQKNNDPQLRLPKAEIDRIKFHFASDQVRVQHDNSKYAPHTKKGRHGVYSFQKSDGSLRFHIGDSAKTQIQEAFYACLETYAPTIIANRTPKLWDIQRKLSVREATRLQGFPDTFKFPVTDAQAYKQLGNAVSVPVVTAIVKQMIKSY